MARVYATGDDVAGWLGDYPPANVATLCARASVDIDCALVGAVYDTDSNGLPTDAAVTQALKDAVCAQIAWWVTQQRPSDGPCEVGWRRLDRADRPGPLTPPNVKGPIPQVAPEACRVLHVAGLLPIQAGVVG